MSSRPPSADSLHHHFRSMAGRDRHEAHHVATPLELLFDLTFVISFGLASQLAQIGWAALIFLHLSVAATFVVIISLGLIELASPMIAERHDAGTPWHVHHIVERYGLFTIIALGEGVVGTVAALSAVIEQQGWTQDAALVGFAGTGLTFAMWWVYYMLPSAPVLEMHRGRSFVWGYGHMLVVTAIVATGAGLHVAAYFIEHKAHISPMAAVLTVAVPVGGFLGLIYALYYYLVRRFDPFHVTLLGATAAVVVGALVAALSGVGMAACLVILMFAPAVTVVGYETRGYRHQAESLVSQGTST